MPNRPVDHHEVQLVRSRRQDVGLEILPSLLMGAMRPMYFCCCCIAAREVSRLAKVFVSCVSWSVRIWFSSVMRSWYMVIESCSVLLASVKLPVFGSVMAL